MKARLPVLAKLRGLARLKAGWRYGRGAATSPVAVGTVARLIRQARRAGVERLDVFPGRDDGGVELAVYRDGQPDGEDYAFLARPDGRVEFGSEGQDLPEEEPLTLAEARDRLAGIAARWAREANAQNPAAP